MARRTTPTTPTTPASATPSSTTPSSAPTPTTTVPTSPSLIDSLKTLGLFTAKYVAAPVVFGAITYFLGRSNGAEITRLDYENKKMPALFVRIKTVENRKSVLEEQVSVQEAHIKELEDEVRESSPSGIEIASRNALNAARGRVRRAYEQDNTRQHYTFENLNHAVGASNALNNLLEFGHINGEQYEALLMAADSLGTAHDGINNDGVIGQKGAQFLSRLTGDNFRAEVKKIFPDLFSQYFKRPLMD